MGMNTAMIIRNDFLHQIKDDPDFGRKVYNAVISAGRDLFSNSAFGVLPSHHADYVQIVKISANSISHFGTGYNGTWTDNDLDILKNMADNMGYRLVKKRK